MVRVRARYSRLTIKTRLVLNVAIAMAVVLAGTSWFVFWRVELALDRQLTRDLSAYHSVVVQAQITGGELPRKTAGQWFQVFDAAYGVTAASKVLPAPYLLPRREFEHASGGERVHYDHGTFIPPDPGAFRTLAARIDLAGVTYVVATAISRQPRDEALHELLIQLVIADLLALVGAAYVGYLTARGALDPVERYRIAATAAGVSSGGRMPVPQDRDDELTRLGNTLNDLLARVEESVQREHRFIADASHELRTPLALLKAEVELALLQPRHPEYNRRVLLSVQAEVDRMVDLANALLDLEELASGQPNPLQAVDVTAMLDAVADRFRPSLIRQNRDIRVRSSHGLVAQLNQRWMDAALSNLIDNAARYGSGAIQLTATTRAGALLVSVSDEGLGFPGGFRADAFDRFTRADINRTTTGSGLGLALVKAVCQAHDGTAAIDPGVGNASVTMAIPFVERASVA